MARISIGYIKPQTREYWARVTMLLLGLLEAVLVCVEVVLFRNWKSAWHLAVGAVGFVMCAILIPPLTFRKKPPP